MKLLAPDRLQGWRVVLVVSHSLSKSTNQDQISTQPRRDEWRKTTHIAPNKVRRDHDRTLNRVTFEEFLGLKVIGLEYELAYELAYEVEATRFGMAIRDRQVREKRRLGVYERNGGRKVCASWDLRWKDLKCRLLPWKEVDRLWR